MKNFCFILMLSTGLALFADNKVSITTKSDRVIATVELNNNEYIYLNEQMLFLFVESDHYNFTFTGYPDGKLDNNGHIYYSETVTLSGKLTLRDGIEPNNYSINVILGFQTTDQDGQRNIPVELSEEILVKQRSNSFNIPVLSGLILIIILTVFLIIKRRKI